MQQHTASVTLHVQQVAVSQCSFFFSLRSVFSLASMLLNVLAVNVVVAVVVVNSRTRSIQPQPLVFRSLTI
jgi:hypothetical protein